MHGRLQKRRKILLVLFSLILGLASLLYAKRGKFLEEIKSSLEKEIAQQLSLSLKIGKYFPRWERRLSFGDISISDKENNFLVLAKKAYFDFSLGDIFFQRFKNIERIQGRIENISLFIKGFRLPLRIASLNAVLNNGYLEIKHLRGILAENFPFELEAILGRLTEEIPKINLQCRFLRPSAEKILSFSIPAVIYLSGDREKILLETLAEAEKPIFYIRGELSPPAGRFNLAISPHLGKESERQDSPVKIQGDFKDSHKSISINFEHFSFLNNELISRIFIETAYNPQEKALEGKICSSGTVLNSLPLPEFEGNYRFKDGILKMGNFKWADSLSLKGEINFLDKLSGNLSFLLENFNLLYLAQLYYPQWNAWGEVSGKGSLEMREGRVFTKGEIEFTEGELGPFKFKGGRVRFEGENNLFKISNTRIYQDKGYFDLNGEVDLKKLGRPDFGKSLVLVSYQEDINWQGWIISQKEPSGPISVDRNIDEKLSIQFRSYMQDYVEPLKEKKEEFGLEYKIKEDRSLKLRLKENEEILGFERKIKF